jgi:hypothetical protein
MAIEITYDPKTGRPNVVSDGHVLLTGAATGTVQLPDGTEYDVTPLAIEVQSQLHGLQVAAVLEGKDPAAVTQEHVDAANAGSIDDPVLASVPSTGEAAE